MGITGKYDFKGIRKMGAWGLTTFFIGTPFGKVLNIWGLGYVSQLFFEWGCNYLANRGLVLLNVAYATGEGAWDQRAFDAAMDAALAEVELKAGKLTPAEIKAIDDKVIQTFLKFAEHSVPKSKS